MDDNGAPGEVHGETHGEAPREAPDDESVNESQLNCRIAELQTFQSQARPTTPCADCGRLHHRSRTPWTQSTPCNPASGLDLDLDQDGLLDAEVGDEDVNFHFLEQIPEMFTDPPIQQLVMVVFNLLMSVLVGVYFDVVLHRIVLRQHPDLYPLPIFLQNLHFLLISGLAFFALERFWRIIVGL